MLLRVLLGLLLLPLLLQHLMMPSSAAETLAETAAVMLTLLHTDDTSRTLLHL